MVNYEKKATIVLGKHTPMKRLAFSIAVITVFSISAHAKYSGGSGTAGDPYQIGSAADLLAMAADTGDYNKYFILTADIDLGSSGTFTKAVIAWDIDNSNAYFDGHRFAGVFDGAGHKINNLTINTNGEKRDYIGLFGSNRYGGEIKNLGLQNVNIIAGPNSQGVAALVGENDTSDITNCFSTGTIIASDNVFEVGGLVGTNYFGNINSCYSTVFITGGESALFLGGLVGDTSNGTISDCCAMSNVSGGYSSGALGGLVGHNSSDLVRCYAIGDITGGGEASDLGGLVGTNMEANIIVSRQAMLQAGMDRIFSAG